MIELVLSIIVSLNLQYKVIDENEVVLTVDDTYTLVSSPEYVDKVKTGEIHDVTIASSPDPYYDIIILPEVDPTSDK